MVRGLFSGLFLFCFVLPILAQPILDLSSAEERAVGAFLTYYADTASHTIEEINNLSHRFRGTQDAVPNFGLTDATYWIRLQTKNMTPEEADWLLEVAYPLLDNVTFYFYEHGVWQTITTGEVYPTSSRPLFYRNFLFPIHQSDTTVRTYYWQVKTEGSMRLPIYVSRTEPLLEKATSVEVAYGFLYGALGIILLYNLFVFFALGEVSYLFYCLFILFNIGVQATFNGHVQLIDLGVQYANLWLLFVMFGATLFAVLFAIRFLQTKRFSPFTHPILITAAYLLGLSLLLTFVLPYHIMAIVASLFFLTVPSVVWLTGLAAWRSGNTAARYFIIAWTAYLISVTLISLRTLGIISGSMPSEVIMQVGSILDAVLLSLALADKINIYRREKIKAQTQALMTAQENERIVYEQKRLLEKRVQERTEEISAQNEELHIQQEVIETLNDQLICTNEQLEQKVTQQTQNLSRTNQQLITQNHRLEQFASVTSHNLRGPIANILGITNIIDRKQLDSFNQQCLDHLDKATQRLDMVISDMNDILIKDATLQPFEHCSFAHLLQEVVKRLATVIQQEKALITSDFRAVTHGYLIKSYGHNILYHLIDNAIKYRDFNCPPVISIRSQLVDTYIVLTIQDNGLGIDVQKYQHKLFGLYQRFHIHREGRGLGLYLVKTQMEAMGGKVEVERNAAGEGTVFRLLLPSAQRDL